MLRTTYFLKEYIDIELRFIFFQKYLMYCNARVVDI